MTPQYVPRYHIVRQVLIGGVQSCGLTGVPKPGWRGFQLLHGAGDHRIPATLASEYRSAGIQSERAGSSDCVTDDATNMAGFTLSSMKADTQAHCCAKCQAVNQQQCSFWTFYNGTCEFKSSDAGR